MLRVRASHTFPPASHAPVGIATHSRLAHLRAHLCQVSNVRWDANPLISLPSPTSQLGNSSHVPRRLQCTREESLQRLNMRKTYFEITTPPLQRLMNLLYLVAFNYQLLRESTQGICALTGFCGCRKPQSRPQSQLLTKFFDLTNALFECRVRLRNHHALDAATAGEAKPSSNEAPMTQKQKLPNFSQWNELCHGLNAMRYSLTWATGNSCYENPWHEECTHGRGLARLWYIYLNGF